jgi:hypothetical protein
MVATGYYTYDHGEFEVAGLIETGSCSERLNCIYRGLVKFDLTPLGSSPKVVTAKLKYEGNFERNSWAEDDNCIASIGTVLSPWGGFDLPAEFFGSSITSSTGFSTGVEVSQLVRNWVTGSSPNHGFIMIGPKENIGKNDNDTCVATLSNIKLESKSISPAAEAQGPNIRYFSARCVNHKRIAIKPRDCSDEIVQIYKHGFDDLVRLV